MLCVLCNHGVQGVWLVVSVFGWCCCGWVGAVCIV